MTNTEILERLIESDFGYETREGSKWGKAVQHDSLVLDKGKGIFYWNSRNIVGDPLVYLMEVRGLSFDQAKTYVNNFLGYTGTFVHTIVTGHGETIVYPKLVEVFFDSANDDKRKREYYYIRGLTDDTIDRYQLGYYNHWSMIPIFEDGSFRNFQMRRDSPKRILSYYKRVGGLLFNSDILKITNKIYYVEGPMDALIMIQNGLPTVASTIGGGFLPEWFWKFIRQKEIYILFDNDRAGNNESIQLSRMLGVGRCKIYNFWDFPEKGYDPVNFFADGNTQDDLMQLISEKSKYSFEMKGV